MPRKSRVEKVSRYQALVNGLEKHFARMVPLVIGGKEWKKEELIGFLEKYEGAMTAAHAAEAEYLAAVDREKTIDIETEEIAKCLLGLVRAGFGHDVEALADFGTAPFKKAVKSAEVKARAADRLRATRAARHTMGPKQKAKIKGGV